MNGQQIAEQYGIDYWGEHPRHAVSDWVYEVRNGDTRLGYWEWVLEKVAQEFDEDCEICGGEHPENYEGDSLIPSMPETDRRQI